MKDAGDDGSIINSPGAGLVLRQKLLDGRQGPSNNQNSAKSHLQRSTPAVNLESRSTSTG
jgi:hypothetical protein